MRNLWYTMMAMVVLFVVTFVDNAEALERKIKFNGKEYYHNGDCGFVKDNKVYVTGRRINTLTYNGLKIAADVINEHILKLQHIVLNP